MSKQVSILIVDDNPAMTQTLVDILGATGYCVHSAYSGREALKVIAEHPIDMVLTDVRMPDMDGVELYRRLRKTHRDVIVFLMTAYAADDIIQDGLREGIQTVLTKPLDIDFMLTMFAAASRTYFGKA